LLVVFVRVTLILAHKLVGVTVGACLRTIKEKKKEKKSKFTKTNKLCNSYAFWTILNLQIAKADLTAICF